MGPPVSILVFVDVPLRRSRPGRTGTPMYRGFNPCFRGCSSETGPGGHPDLPRQRVSILVFVDVPLRLDQDDRADRQEPEFQSLFSWMFL